VKDRPDGRETQHLRRLSPRGPGAKSPRARAGRQPPPVADQATAHRELLGLGPGGRGVGDGVPVSRRGPRCCGAASRGRPREPRRRAGRWGDARPRLAIGDAGGGGGTRLECADGLGLRSSKKERTAKILLGQISPGLLRAQSYI